MKRAKYVLMAAAILVAGSMVTLFRNREQAVAAGGSKEAAVPEVYIAAPGRVEAISEELRVSSEMSGRLKTVSVEEGDRVLRSQVIAEVENADYRARVSEAEAEVARREAEVRRIVNGARTQERQEAQAALEAAEALRKNAKSEAERRRVLADRDVISRDEAERFERTYQVAQAQQEQAKQHFEFVNAAAREEDRSKAEAELAVAKAQLAEARAYYEKSLIRAPMDGVILRKLRHTGESVSTQFDSPVITMADDSRLRVRMDVDEQDVSKLRVGQKAYVTAVAYGSEKYWGKVIRVGRILGRKNIRTDEPSEHIDTKILETLLELDGGVRLPLGLRVDSYVQVELGDLEDSRNVPKYNH